MIPNIDGKSPRPIHQEILEEGRVMVNRVMDVLSICQHIMAIWRVNIKRGEFQECTLGKATVETMIADAQHVLQYRR